MKKKLFVICLLCCLYYSTFANDKKSHQGIYLPVDYIELLHKYKNHEKAVLEILNTHYTVLYISESRCSTAYEFDHFSVIEEEILKKWSYSVEGNNKYITDENGYLYKKISDYQTKFPSGYIADCVFESYHDDNIKISNNTITINNIEYQIKLKPNHPREKVQEYSLHLYILDYDIPERFDYFVILENDGFKIIEGVNINDRWIKPVPEKIVYVYPNIGINSH